MWNGIIYRGPSQITGDLIVVIATFTMTNRKTGPILQTYILVDGIDPLTASKTGADVAICGDCKFRGTPTDDPNKKQATDRDCYVILYQAPLAVYRAYLRGYYPDATSPAQRRALGFRMKVRIGSYGDPAAAPPEVWADLLEDADGFTAYTHQSGALPHIAMQSVETYDAAAAHWAAGHRTFRVIQSLDEVDPANEVICPASAEIGRTVQCTSCMLCAAPKRAKSIAIVQH